MDFEHLKEFVVFSRYLNITRASQELHMTQSSLSKHIKQLEAELGFGLVHKRSGRIHLTREGECFLNFCNVTVVGYERTIEKCRHMKLSRRYEIVAQEPSHADATAESYYRAIEELCSVSPDFTVRYVRPYRKNVTDELKSPKLDLAISYRNDARSAAEAAGASDDSGLVGRPLTSDSLSIWCEVDHPLAQKEFVSLEDLSEHLIIQPNDTYAPIRRLLMGYEKERGLRFLFNMVESDRAATFLSMRCADCVYVLPSSIENDLRVRARKDRVLVPLEGGTLKFTSYVVMHKSKISSFTGLEDAFREFFEATSEG